MSFSTRSSSSSLCPSSVSSGGGPGPLKPVLPPQPLPVSQPLGGTSQPPPPISTTHPYQVMEKQPHSVGLPGGTNSCCSLLALFQTAAFTLPKTFYPALSSFNLLADRIQPPWLLLRWLHRWPWRQPTTRRVAVSYPSTLWASGNNLCLLRFYCSGRVTVFLLVAVKQILLIHGNKHSKSLNPTGATDSSSHHRFKFRFERNQVDRFCLHVYGVDRVHEPCGTSERASSCVCS